MREYLEFVGDSQHSDATSSKFWEVIVDGPTITVRWGKIGSKGRSNMSTYDSHSIAQAEARKQVEAKAKKGYRSTSPAAPAEATQKSAPGITDKQLALLRRLVVERQVPPEHEAAAGTLEGLTRAQASSMISALLEQPKKPRETSTAYSTADGASADAVLLTAKQRGLILRLLDEREVPADLTLTPAEIDALTRGKASEIISSLLDSPKREHAPPASREPDWPTSVSTAVALSDLENDVQAASGELVVFAAWAWRTSGDHATVLPSRNPIADDVLVSMGLDESGDAKAWLVLEAAGIIDDDSEGISDPDTALSLMYSVGPQAPDWWSDLSMVASWIASEVDFRGDYPGLVYDMNAMPRAADVILPGNEQRVVWVAHVFELVRQALNDESTAEYLADVRALCSDAAFGVNYPGDAAFFSKVLTRALARHPNTPPEILTELAVHEEQAVRWLVSRNPASTDLILASVHLGATDEFSDLEDRAGAPEWEVLIYTEVDAGLVCEAMDPDEFRESHESFFQDTEASWLDEEGRFAYDSRHFDELDDDMREDVLFELIDRWSSTRLGKITLSYETL